MLIKNNPIYSRNFSIVVVIVEFFIIILSATLLILASLGQYVGNEGRLYGVSTVIWVLGIVSVPDIFKFFKTGKSFVASFIGKIVFRFNKFKRRKKLNLTPTEEQREIINNYFANTLNSFQHNYVIINGEKGTGKSECVNFILKEIFSKIRSDQNLIEHTFYYIDCYNSAAESIDFIKNLNSQDLNNKILFIDNCNETDGQILTALNKFIRFKNCSLLLIEEGSSFFITSELQKLCNTNFFSNKTFSKTTSFDSNWLKKVNKLQIRILFSIDLFSKYYHLFSINEIIDLLKLNKKEKYQSYFFLNRLRKKNIIYNFPIFTHYFKITDEECWNSLKENFVNDHKQLFYEIVKTFEQMTTNEEIKWLCLFELPLEEIKSYTDLKSRFNNAIAYGNYDKLLNVLTKYCKWQKCKNEFSYEWATLHYYTGDYQSAISCCEQADQLGEIERTIFTIELLHGSKEPEIKKKIDKEIEFLKTKDKLCGNYWEYHILSERGTFQISKMYEVLKSLIEEYNNNSNQRIKTALQRSFTDMLRFRWMEGRFDETEFLHLKEEFADIFQSDPNYYRYYYNLYFKAGHLHYSIIPHDWINDQLNRLEERIEQAKNYYNSVIESSYENKKSKSAAETKLADLLLMGNQYEYDKINESICAFKESSTKQKIDVFVAYSETLLAKAAILETMLNFNLPPTNEKQNYIESCLNTAQEIFSEYENQYGINRCRYLLFLYRCLLNFKTENESYESFDNDLKELQKSCDKLAQQFIEKLLRYRKPTYLSIYNSIKYYPIILQ